MVRIDIGINMCQRNDHSKAGNTEFSEESVYGTDFDDVKVYLSGIAK